MLVSVHKLARLQHEDGTAAERERFVATGCFYQFVSVPNGVYSAGHRGGRSGYRLSGAKVIQLAKGHALPH
jgi:hypothetical protein